MARLAEGLWRLADPKISLASLAAMALGACAAAAAGPMLWGPLALTVAGILALEAAKNASGELFDLRSDAAVAPEDRSPFSGGKRVIVDGLLSPGQTAAIAAAGYLLGAAAGLALAAREPRLLWLGAAGVAVAYFYNAPPVRLSYHGLGEAAVALAYGPGIVAGTYLVQRGRLDEPALLLSVPLGLLVAAFLWANEFPDYRADLAAGKRNWVVRLGRPRAARGYAVLVGAALASCLLAPVFGAPAAAWLGLLAGAPAARAARLLLDHPEETSFVVRAQGLSLAAFVLFAAASGAGLVLAGG